MFMATTAKKAASLLGGVVLGHALWYFWNGERPILPTKENILCTKNKPFIKTYSKNIPCMSIGFVWQYIATVCDCLLPKKWDSMPIYIIGYVWMCLVYELDPI